MNRSLKWVTIMDLRLPGDWKARLASDVVRQLADSGDILQPPAIRKADSSVIWGADRIAAARIRGATEIEVWIVECREDEVADLRDTENAFRRNPDLEARARLVSRRAAAIQAEADAPSNSLTPVSESEPPKRGRPPTAQGKARAEMAAKLGVTKNALEVQAHREKAEQRAEAEAQGQGPVPTEQEAPGSVPSPAPPPGADIAEKLDAINALLVQATGLVTKLAREHPELVERFPLQALKFQLQREVAPGFRAIRPEATCLYCKEIASELANCAACRGSGWLTKDALVDVPRELLQTGDAAGIFVAGKFVTLLQLVAADGRKAKKPGAALRALLSSPDVKAGHRADGRGGQTIPRTMDVRVVDEHGGEKPWTDAWVEE